jgi:DNA topoisomerase-1
MKVDFPQEYANWSRVDLFKLIRADVVKYPIEKRLVELLKKEAKNADYLIIATDFDREGELIGYDVLRLVKEVNPKIIVKRARFSALIKDEIKKAFGELQET